MPAPQPPDPPDFFQTVVRAGIALIPGVGGAVQVIYEDVLANIAHRQWQTIQDIAAEVGDDRLGQSLKADPVRQALFVNGVEVATRTGMEAKRRLLAKVISAAMLDDDKVDGAQLRVEALRDLDVPQIRALEQLRRFSDQHPGDAYSPGVQAIYRALPAPIRAALTRTGVAFEPSEQDTYGYSVDGINDFGRGLLEELDNVDAVDWEGTKIDKTR